MFEKTRTIVTDSQYSLQGERELNAAEAELAELRAKVAEQAARIAELEEAFSVAGGMVCPDV